MSETITIRYWLRRDGGAELPLGRQMTFGRAPSCDLVIESGLVSRVHMCIRADEDGLVVEDLASRNGVLVNQRKVTGRTRVVHGDVVTVGLESFEIVDRFLIKHPAHLSTLPPPPRPYDESDVDSLVEETTVTPGLSERERQVLELLALGHAHKDIAKKLCISVKTVETHRTRIAEKLSCTSRAELVSYALEVGLLHRRPANG